MSNVFMRSVILALLCALCGATACDRHRNDPSSQKKSGTAALASPTARVVVHITGLALVVPPHDNQTAMHVLLPVVPPGGVAQHVAVLGFGIGSDSSFAHRLCLNDLVFGQPARKAGICYVDLDRWSLDPFGSGGQPSPPDTRLPGGLVDVTRLAGGNHRVLIPMLDDHIRSDLVFVAGAPGDSCALARWTFEAVNAVGQVQREERQPLLNVVDWVIRSPLRRELVFRLKTNPNSTIVAPLPNPDANGAIELVLAHVPTADLLDLPPSTAGLGDLPDFADHFDVYYDLLRVPGNPAPIPPASTRRRLPHSPVPLTNAACVVGITRTVATLRETMKLHVAPALHIAPALQVDTSLGTYACMPATGH
jgi:hypothetical protein